MEESRNFNNIVAKPLREETNEDWFEWVKNYLISQYLWKVTSRSARSERYRVKDYGRWRRKNATALQVIHIPCGPHNLPFIRGASEPKLHGTFSIVPTIPATTLSSPRFLEQDLMITVMTEVHEMDMAMLPKAISENNWSAAKAFIDGHPRALNMKLVPL